MPPTKDAPSDPGVPSDPASSEAAPSAPGRWVPLGEAGARAAYGGKGAALARLAGAGLPVPAGIALDPPMVTGIATGTARHREELARALAAIRAAAAPDRVAVRSSAIDEDGGGASFAGQHATLLGIPPELDAVAAAVAAVWKSAREPSALAYRARLGLPGEPLMAVVIQRLVDAEIAGVAFSRHPVTGADEIVVEASWGLGEAVVAGLVTPDHARLSPHGVLLERRVGWKDVALRVVDGGVAEHPVPADRIEAVAATDTLLAEVVRLVHRCASALGGPQDVEWAWADGTLHCLQSRPITRAGGAMPGGSPRPGTSA